MKWSPAGLTFLFLLLAVTPPMAAPREEVLPPVTHLSIYRILVDTRPVDVTLTAAWQRVPATVTKDALLSDHTIWRYMHFGDWDRVPDHLRDAGLTRMLARYEHVVHDAARWHHMTAYDWDEVPQPIRAMAYLRMVEHWASAYRVGEAYGFAWRPLADRLKAIAMAESWFEHRAVNVNHDGAVDLGIAQASEYAREVLRRRHKAGAVDFTFEDEDYFNPMQSIRMMVYWFDLMLEEADGDLDLATRAYNRGISWARRGAGQEYAASVARSLERYIQPPSASPSWNFLQSRLRLAAQPLSPDILLAGPAGGHVVSAALLAASHARPPSAPE